MSKFEELVQAPFDAGNYVAAFQAAPPFAEQGHRTAQEILGNCYQMGFGTTIDMAQAAYWYERAIAQGSGLAANNLSGIVAYHGYAGHPPDRERGQALLDQARSLGFEHAPKKLLF
jgi:TPR repeat protein